MKKLYKRLTIDPCFTAADWNLNDTATDDIVRTLNASLKIGVNGGWPVVEVRKFMLSVMEGYREYGACSSKSMYLLQEVLIEIYGEEDDWK